MICINWLFFPVGSKNEPRISSTFTPIIITYLKFSICKRLSISQPYQILVRKSFWSVKGIKLFSRKIGTYVIYLNVFSRCNVKIIYQCKGRSLIIQKALCFAFFIFPPYFLDWSPSSFLLVQSFFSNKYFRYSKLKLLPNPSKK